MTPSEVLAELAARMGASQGNPLLISARELREWPVAVVATLKAQKLISRTRPSDSTECLGCECACTMPVHVLPASQGRESNAFVVCDKRDDINRVAVPIEYLEQWRVDSDHSPESIAKALGILLPRAVTEARSSRQSARNAAIRKKFAELDAQGVRNFVKEIQRSVQGASSLSSRSIRRIVHGR